jgi:membrane protein DedA with SNARE-associated domain
MVNSSSVDALLWKGSPKATKVQRVGIAIWGLTFLSLGAFFVFVLASEQHSLMAAVIGLFGLALGTRITFKAFRRAPKLKGRNTAK